MSSHFASAAGSEMRAFRKSDGMEWTAPAESDFLAMDFILHRKANPPKAAELRHRAALAIDTYGRRE